MAGEGSDAQECVLREELTRVLGEHRHAINDDIDRKFAETNATLQQLNESIAMLNTRIDGLANQPPNNGRADPQGAAHDHEFDNDNEMRAQFNSDELTLFHAVKAAFDPSGCG